MSNARNKIWLLSLRLVKLQSRIIHGAKIIIMIISVMLVLKRW